MLSERSSNLPAALLLLLLLALHLRYLHFPPHLLAVAPRRLVYCRSVVKMMQEVSIMVAYDAHVVERPGEEDALARLVAHSRPLRSIRPVVGQLVGRLRSFASYCGAGLFLPCSSVRPLRTSEAGGPFVSMVLVHSGFGSGEEENLPSKVLLFCLLFCSCAVKGEVGNCT